MREGFLVCGYTNAPSVCFLASMAPAKFLALPALAAVAAALSINTYVPSCAPACISDAIDKHTTCDETDNVCICQNTYTIRVDGMVCLRDACAGSAYGMLYLDHSGSDAGLTTCAGQTQTGIDNFCAAVMSGGDGSSTTTTTSTSDSTTSTSTSTSTETTSTETTTETTTTETTSTPLPSSTTTTESGTPTSYPGGSQSPTSSTESETPTSSGAPTGYSTTPVPTSSGGASTTSYLSTLPGGSVSSSITLTTTLSSSAGATSSSSSAPTSTTVPTAAAGRVESGASLAAIVAGAMAYLL
ncbi:hypothetical protein F5Y18DRAFT_44104 [Xylariaceae sp. FL1019]|nr:hypothetical protein F5Y18DRAFT_44104 [Xylariaceae sp. FL1019]